jgi:hypothetical protein
MTQNIYVKRGTPIPHGPPKNQPRRIINVNKGGGIAATVTYLNAAGNPVRIEQIVDTDALERRLTEDPQIMATLNDALQRATRKPDEAASPDQE